MRIFWILILFATQLSAVNIIDGDRTINFSSEQLQLYQEVKLETSREEKKKDDKWIGAYLLDIFSKYEISDYTDVKFISDDNYLVRLSKEEITQNKPIIAYNRNGKPMKKIRLVVSQMRDMFWIQGIKEIFIERNKVFIEPKIAFTAANLLKEKKLRNELPPFIEVKGYTFLDLVEDVFPLQQEEVILIGKDGVFHKLDFEKYLKNAVLVKSESSYDFKSPAMPAGMWIKDIAVIQQLDRLIIFPEHFNDLTEVFQLINLKEIPENIKLAEKILKTEKITRSILEMELRIEW